MAKRTISKSKFACHIYLLFIVVKTAGPIRMATDGIKVAYHSFEYCINRQSEKL